MPYGLTDRDFIQRKKEGRDRVAWILFLPLPDGNHLVIKSRKPEAEAIAELGSQRDVLIEQLWSDNIDRLVRLAPSHNTEYMETYRRNRSGKIGVSHQKHLRKFAATWREGPQGDRRDVSVTYGYSPYHSRYVGSMEDAFVAACIKRDRMTGQTVQPREHYAEIFRKHFT